MSVVLTHDRINVAGGVLAKKGILYGGNALQSITIGRHTPKDPVQAVGHLGIVDYVSGVITSDITLDAVLVEGTQMADATSSAVNSAYRFAGQTVTVGNEEYVLTSAALAFSAGQPTTFNIGYLTPTLATELDVQDQPDPETGEESSYAVVMGDDGSGIKIVTTWYSGSAPTAGTVSIMNSSGQMTTVTDGSLPAGIQSLHASVNINHDNILDVRSSHPQTFVTTYPLDFKCDMEVYCLPSAAARPGEVGYDPATFRNSFADLATLAVVATALGKHPSGSTAGHAANNATYMKVIGLNKIDESEAIAVGRHLTWTVNFTAADLRLPLDDPNFSS